MKPLSKPIYKNQNVLFFILLAAMAILYGYYGILFMRPWSIHQWRQCDCLSITYNYYKEGMHFFSPTINWSGPTGDGKTSTSEFPWLYYFIACLWKLFGYHEYIYRMVNTAIAFCGLYFLFKLCREILQDGFWSLIISLFLFTSPIFVYYGNNFIVDVPSLSIALIAWYYFYKFYKNGANKYFYAWMFFCLLAGLTKITALLSFIPVFLIFPIEALGIYRFKDAGKVFTKPLQFIPAFVISISVILAWTLYAIHYNKIHNTGVFSTQTYPIWTSTRVEFMQVLRDLYNTLLPLFINTFSLFAILLILLVIMLVRKEVNNFLLYMCLCLFLGCPLYLCLWFRVFTVHDYYLINLLIFIPCILITFLHYLKKKHPSVFQSYILKVTTALVFLFNIYYCMVQTQIRYNPMTRFITHSFIISNRELDEWDWYHRSYMNYFESFETITPYLRSMGIARTDKVISLPDESPNISLYLMDQKGYTNYKFEGNKPEVIKKYIKQGVKYLVVNNHDFIDTAWVKPYTSKQIGCYRNIYIFDLTYKMTRKDTLYRLIRKIKASPEWLNTITKSAQEKGVPLDSALMDNALWLIQNKHADF